MRPDLALLRAVLHDPADDPTRLVFADWLEDHGHPWAAVARDRPEVFHFIAGLATADEIPFSRINELVHAAEADLLAAIASFLEVSLDLVANPRRDWLPGQTLEHLADAHALTPGRATASAALRSLHRLTPEGPVGPDLAQELRLMGRLFDGACRVACLEVGHPPPEAPGGEEAAGVFREWAAGLNADRDVGGDARVMVPVFRDAGREHWKAWAFLGWNRTLLEVDYEEEPEVISCEQAGHAPGDAAARPRLEFVRQWCEAATPVFAEVYVSRLLNRDEFRRYCDRHKTRDAILAHLD